MISKSSSGSTTKTMSFLKAMQTPRPFASLESLAQRGVSALQAATPIEDGTTAGSWSYEIERKNGSITIHWINTNNVNGVNIAVILQYGHGTGTGGYVAGRDYINGALKPIFDEIDNEVWKRVTSA